MFATWPGSETFQPNCSLSNDILFFVFFFFTGTSLLLFNYTQKPIWFCVLWFVFHSVRNPSCTPTLHARALETMFWFGLAWLGLAWLEIESLCVALAILELTM